jgi:hypothetical protein
MWKHNLAAQLGALVLAISGSVASAQQSKWTPADPFAPPPVPATPLPMPATLPDVPATPPPVPMTQPISALLPPTSHPMITAPAGDNWFQTNCSADTGHVQHFTPFMLGDFIGPVANLFSDVKIAEGESPRPVDRAYYRFNYYDNIDQPEARDPRRSFHNVNLYQNVFGFEKTFFDRTVSLGLRVPFYTMTADGKDFIVTDATGTPTLQHGDSFSETEFGNVAAIAKAVLWENKQTGSLLSAGATLSFPTASSVRLNPGQSILAYMQPFVGVILQDGDLFVQGFSSLTIPIARTESIVFFNDLGVGYHMYRANSGMIHDIAPTLEMHIATPIRQPDPAVFEFGIVDDVRLHNVVDFTLGATVEMEGGATLGLGLCVPVTSPRPFDIEFIAQLNYRF